MLQSFAFCYHTQRLRLVWVEGAEADYLRLVPEDGALFRYKPKQLLHRWEAEAPALTDVTARDFLRERARALEAATKAIDVVALHTRLPADEAWAFTRIVGAAQLPNADPWT